MATIAQLHPAKPTLEMAIDALFTDRDLAATTQRAYRACYQPLLDTFGDQALVTSLTPAKLKRWFSKQWGQSAPATWNARLTALQALAEYCQRQEWIAKNPTLVLERRRVPRNDNRAITFDALSELWLRPIVALREKTLWRMLYATAARAREVLELDVQDLDLGRKRAGIIGKGGHHETIIWDAGTARLLPRYLAGRRRGPLFVTESLPNVIPADGDQSPDGRGRLSYQRAWHLFHVASEGRWTLHQLRHSALTHLGEDGVSAPLLMAKSRHRDLRTLSRYVRPGTEAVARLTAEHDRERRRR